MKKQNKKTGIWEKIKTDLTGDIIGNIQEPVSELYPIIGLSPSAQLMNSLATAQQQVKKHSEMQVHSSALATAAPWQPTTTLQHSDGKFYKHQNCKNLVRNYSSHVS